jgi:hypothetical protein
VLESALAAGSSPLLLPLKALGLKAAPLYAADLAQLLGPRWEERVPALTIPATKAYAAELQAAARAGDGAALLAAAFILYGALVVGGGKATQAKVRRVFPGCEHALFDVMGEDVKGARGRFRECFDGVGEKHPEKAGEIEGAARKFMGRNNEVIAGVSVVGPRLRRWGTWAALAGGAYAAVRWKGRK